MRIYASGNRAFVISAALIAGLFTAGCGKRHDDKRNGTATPAAALTYYRDVKPVVDAKCVGCHQPGNIAPFSLVQPEQVVAHRQLLVEDVATQQMPPWPASHDGPAYRNDRSLTAAETATLTSWVDAGAPLGDPATTGAALTQPDAGMERVDLTLTMSKPYKPTMAPDEYRCFVLDWPEAAPTHVTGFGVVPGNRGIVHHLIAYVAPPEAAAKVEALAAGSPDRGYTCFGGPKVPEADWLGVWAPGTQGSSYPKDTGILVRPGSKMILQIHYNLQNILTQAPAAGRGGTDQTSVQFSLAAKVKTEAFIIGWDDDRWIRDKDSMLIPANAPDTMHSFSADVTKDLGNKPVTILGAFHHMHQLGKAGELRIDRANKTKDLIVTIPKWDFHWQLQYWLAQPLQLNPGDQLTIECHWDNTPAAQPVIDGVQQQPRDVRWGDGSSDEMCFGTFYAVLSGS